MDDCSFSECVCKVMPLSLALVMLSGCDGDSSENMNVDCSISTLEVVQIMTTQADCDIDGSIEVGSEGGEGTVEFSLDGSAFQTSGIFSVSAGTYTVTAQDEEGCTATTQVVVGSASNSVTLIVSSTSPSGCSTSQGTISASGSGGDGNYTFALDGGMSQNSGSFTGLSAGTYSLTVEDDAGCSSSRSVEILSGVSLDSDVMPIFASNCTGSGCHDGDRGDNSNWTIKSSVINRGTAILSRMSSSSNPMPPSGQLSANLIDLVECWVDDGLPNN